MKTHTPGPWECPNWFNKMTGCWPVNLPSGQIEVRTDNGLADAKLTAAAPELLAALEELENVLHHTGPCQCCSGSSEEPGHDDNCPILKARAAIAKATAQ